MPQFTPTPQDEMLETVREKEWCYDASKCGEGIKANQDRDYQHDIAFGGLARNYGWYHDCSLYTSDGGNKIHILMPIKNVDVDN